MSAKCENLTENTQLCQAHAATLSKVTTMQNSTYGDLTRPLLGDSIREGVLQGSCVKVDASTAARKPAGFVQLRG